VAVDAATGRVYLTVLGVNAVLVLDGENHALLASIPTGALPMSPAVHPATHRVYGITGDPRSHGVWIVDGRPGSPTENTRVGTIAPPERQMSGGGIAIDVLRNRIYVPSFDPGGSVLVIDGETDTLLRMIPVAANPFAAVFDPTTDRVYVGHGSFFLRRRLTTIDAATGEAADGPESFLGTNSLAMDPVPGRLWGHRGDPSRGETLALLALDTKTGVVEAQIARPGNGVVAVNPVTVRVYSVSVESEALSVVDGARGSPTELQVVAIAAVGIGGKYLAVNSRTRRVYVT
jgi:DNA-binding beta-propeller fold protein YncE